MAKTPKNAAELHALIWDHLGVPPSNRRSGHIEVYPMNETWRAKSAIQTADTDFCNNVIAISIMLSEKYDLVQ